MSVHARPPASGACLFNFVGGLGGVGGGGGGGIMKKKKRRGGGWESVLALSL
jgi:hypothetical protein